MNRPNRNRQIAAGIVTFNPDLRRLADNIQAIVPQVDCLYVVDNGSTNFCEVARLATQYPNVQTLANANNEGVAKALNQLADAAWEDSFRVMLFLDQDSVCADTIAETLLLHMNKHVALVSPQIIDRNKEGDHDPRACLDYRTYEVVSPARKGIITSGSLTNLAALKHVGGFDENFFIDYVDYDLNSRFLLEKYKLIRTGDTYLLHECGAASATFLWTPRKGQDERWKIERFYSFGHSPFRCYYKARNRILYFRKYKRTARPFAFYGASQILPQIILTVLFENQRLKKFRFFARGIIDGSRAPVVPYRVHDALDREDATA